MRRWLVLLPVAVLLYACGGCARTPSSVTASSGYVTVTMTVSGQIEPYDYYYVVFNNAEDSTGQNGPVPVIAAPWGNGFVAPKILPSGGSTNYGATSFVEYTATQTNEDANDYGFYKFVPGSDLQQYNAAGVPLQDTAVATAGNTIQFEIPLSMLATNGQSVSAISYMQVNMIATNIVPTNPDYTGPPAKIFDSLGNTADQTQLSDYITINTQTSGTYSSSLLNDEPVGDEGSYPNGAGGGFVSGGRPDLDISGWTIQVTQ